MEGVLAASRRNTLVELEDHRTLLKPMINSEV